MTTSYLRKLRLFGRDARLFLVAAGFIGLAYYGGAAVLQNLYLLRLGYGPEFIGLVFAVGSLMSALFSLPAQAFSRRWGVRRVMMLGMVTMPVGAALLPFAEFVPAGWRSAWILGASALSWMGGPLFMVNSAPFLAGSTNSEERSYAFAVFMAVFPFAGFAGGLVSGSLPQLFAGVLGTSLASPAPFRYPLWLAAALYIPGLLALLATRGDRASDSVAESREAGRAPTGIIVVLGAVALLRMTAAGAVQSFFNVYLDSELHLPPARIGTLMAIGQLLGGFAALAAPILMERRGKQRTFVAASLGASLGYLPLAFIPHWLAAGVGFLGITAMGSIAQPTVNVFGQDAVEPRWRTSVSGAAVMAMGLGYALAGLVGGRAITALGFRPFFTVVGFLPAAGALLFRTYFRLPRGRRVRGPAPELVE